jgi:Tfp pilus assembly protein PilX
MIYVRNQRGVALITALMFTLICLTIIMGMMYLLTRGIQSSASNKRYKTALEASYGGAEIALKEVIPQVFQGYSSSQLQSTFGGVNLQAGSNTCLNDKLNHSSGAWSLSCSKTLDAKTSPDFTMQLQAQGSQPYNIYTKIVDTVAGNSDTSGLQLEGSGVAESSSLITPQHFPYLYRVEVQAERATANAQEKAVLSVQYAY